MTATEQTATEQTTIQKASYTVLDIRESAARRAGLPEIRQEILDELHRRATSEYALVKIMGQPMALSLMHSIYNA